MKRIVTISAAAILAVGCGSSDSSTGSDATQDLVKLSQYDSAGIVDVAIGPDGTLHALFTEESPKRQMDQVYYRSSTDGGATWSTAQNLSEDDDRRVGAIRLVVDGAGRAYAFWRAMKGTDGDSPAQDIYAASLVYRVLEGGAWSSLVSVGPKEEVVSFFPAVDPSGTVHVVWSEYVVTSEYTLGTRFGAVVKQATVNGRTVGDAKELIHGSAVKADSSIDYYAFDDYKSLRGYVDATGTAHWVAVKTPAFAADTDRVQVLWDGKQEKTLFTVSRFKGPANWLYAPAQLVVDAQGQEHVIVQDTKSDHAAVKDYSPSTGADPVVIRETQDMTGEVRTVQAVASPTGQLSVLMTLRDKGDIETPFELMVSSYAGGAWAAAAVVADEGSGAFKQFDDGTNIATRYEASNAAGVFDAAGRLNLLMVDDEIVSVSDGSGAGAYSNSAVYFLKL